MCYVRYVVTILKQLNVITYQLHFPSVCCQLHPCNFLILALLLNFHVVHPTAQLQESLESSFQKLGYLRGIFPERTVLGPSDDFLNLALLLNIHIEHPNRPAPGWGWPQHWGLQPSAVVLFPATHLFLQKLSCNSCYLFLQCITCSPVTILYVNKKSQANTQRSCTPTY